MINFDLLNSLKQKLVEKNLNPKIATWIFMHVHKITSNNELPQYLQLPITKVEECWDLVDRYISGEPLARLTGHTCFCGIDYYVNHNVFCPRTETELLVDNVTKCITNIWHESKKIRILDMCSGTGVIGISTKILLSNYEVDLTLVDVSTDAIENCKLNIISHGLNASVIQSNLFANLSTKNKFDVIISNPPYIDCTCDVGSTSLYDPNTALFADNNGYAIYEDIIAQLSNYISNSNKYLIAFEIGCNQEKYLSKLLLKFDPSLNIEIIRDYNNINRIVIASKNYEIQNI